MSLRTPRSSFVPRSVRIASTAPGDRTVTLGEDEQRPKVYRAQITEHADVAPNAAFRTPDGKIVLIVANDSWSRRSISVQYNGRYAELNLAPGATGTLRMGRIASIVCCLSLAAGSVRTQAQDTVRHAERTRNTFFDRRMVETRRAEILPGGARRPDDYVPPPGPAGGTGRVAFRRMGCRSADDAARYGWNMELTIGPVEPRIYQYKFRIDGFETVDPVNPDVKAGTTIYGSVVEVRGGEEPPLRRTSPCRRRGTPAPPTALHRSGSCVRRGSMFRVRLSSTPHAVFRFSICATVAATSKAVGCAKAAWPQSWTI